MNKIIEDYKKIVAGNEAGKNICFMSRGEYADPKIAYNGILMNYWDVYDCMDEVEEPTDDDWLNAVSNLFDSYTYDVKNVDWSLSKRLSRNTRRLEQACLIGMFGEYLEV